MKLSIIGGGPAGLRAAEVAAAAGCRVTLYEGMPSVGRKFLVAGHGGLNLTHSEPLERFASRYEGGFQTGFWTSLLKDFSNQEIRNWASDLGIGTFIGTSGRVFPKEFKAAPLLRSWVRRLRSLGVKIQTRHILQHITPKDDLFLLSFSTSEEMVTAEAEAVILALGGASWPQTGSDAKWVTLWKGLGLPVAPFEAANCGWEVKWDDLLDKDILELIEGHPLKNLAVRAGEKRIAGELLITKYGLEGGAIYQLGSTLRKMERPLLHVDLKPSFQITELASKITGLSGDFMEKAAKAWRLGPAAAALLRSVASRSSARDPLALATLAKNLPIPLTGPAPIAEAISSAGGVGFEGLDDFLMAMRLPGLFVAGEMIDWEAPTGGYLLQGCFATGTRAAKGAISYLRGKS